MNFLADESCAGPVIRALRQAGHEVVAIAEIAKGSTDEQVLDCALKEKRVLITEDLDFGRLVYARGHSTAGVLLLPFRSRQGRIFLSRCHPEPCRAICALVAAADSGMTTDFSTFCLSSGGF